MATVSCLSDVRPPMTIHQPSIWADTFTNSSSDEKEQQKYADAIEQLKEEARDMLMAATTSLNQMILIDTIELLGLAYLFETEIEHKLQQITHDNHLLHHSDLFTTSLGFRLLRQHRHRISCDVFNKFVNKDGMFGEGDVEGMLSLYEAAHVRFNDEKILQEAADFTRHYLSSREAGLESHLKDRVKRALKRPLHRDIPIVYARIFISIYEKDPSRNELLLKLAKLNFNFLQNLYRKELSQLYRWWNEFDLKSKLPYARDRVVEAYVWGVGYHYEPQYSHVRMGIAKGLKIIGMMDDTYDNYATINQAQLFTEILHKWNMGEVDRLPEYMRTVYHFIMSTCQDYERDALKLGKAFATPYFIETSEPKIAISTGMLGRYSDDIGSHDRESKGGQVLTAIDCYMKQHGVTKQETLSEFARRVEEGWMDVNKEWVQTAFVPREIALQFLNYARMCDATYNNSNGDAYTDPEMAKPTVRALFIDPILV
ncbi:gamma-cadinene synthase-like isoform X2 [Salvia splendens]|uniref:gamma-cadinene synthase-like isoform X2 n=1 Tax=Salvia splendens TaxID=180675 RepID=UPI001C258A9B|nr:gamma-cadinene synthase-like isoform X2 [Salvia splendens]